MPCTSVTVTGAGTGGDKFYDCVKGECKEVAGGKYKNDPKCGGKCKEEKPTDWGTILLGATVLIALATLLGGKRQ